LGYFIPGLAVIIDQLSWGDLLLGKLELQDNAAFKIGLAVLLPFLSLLGQLALDVHVPHIRFMLFIPAVFLVSWTSGLWPGVLTTLLSFAASLYFFAPDGASALIFLGTGFMFSMFNDQVRDLLAHETESQKELRERERLLAAVTDALPAYVSYIDRDHRYRFANAAFEPLTGFTKTQIVGKKVSEVVGEKAYANVSAELAKVFSANKISFERSQPVKGSFRFLRFEYIPDLDEQRQVKGAVAVVTDITKKKVFENALKESEERFRTLTAFAPVGIFQTDPEGNCLMVNERWQQMSGLTWEQTKGTGWVNALHPDDRGRVAAEWYESARAGKEFQSEYRFQSPSGVVTDMRGAAVALRDENGHVKGYIGTITDVTQLKEAIRVRDDFLSIASHELKTPLTSLKLQSQIFRHKLQKGSTSPPTLESFLKLVNSTERQVERLTRLVEDMLDIARIRSGKMNVERTRVDLSALAQEVIERFQLQARAAGSPIHFEGRDPVAGTWDGYRIEQVLTNLLSNALKYGEGKPIEVRVLQLGERAVITVQDQGCGIPENIQDRIFQKFERAVSHSNISGLGLGLYIAKQIVDIHGGAIRVSSKPGCGSSFTVELPVGQEEAVRPAALKENRA
jgi:PAS domain S-box-containing protein